MLLVEIHNEWQSFYVDISVEPELLTKDADVLFAEDKVSLRVQQAFGIGEEPRPEAGKQRNVSGEIEIEVIAIVNSRDPKQSIAVSKVVFEAANCDPNEIGSTCRDSGQWRNVVTKQPEITLQCVEVFPHGAFRARLEQHSGQVQQIESVLSTRSSIFMCFPCSLKEEGDERSSSAQDGDDACDQGLVMVNPRELNELVQPFLERAPHAYSQWLRAIGLVYPNDDVAAEPRDGRPAGQPSDRRSPSNSHRVPHV